MPKRSKFDQLPDQIKEAIGKLWRTRRYSLDELLQKIAELDPFGDNVVSISRSGLHRGLVDYEKAAEGIRQAQDFAKMVMDRAGENPEGDIARAVSELLKSHAFKVLMEAAQGQKNFKANELMLLSMALKHVTASDRSMNDLRAKLEAEALEKAKRQVGRALDAAARAKGLSKDTVAAIKADLIGLKTPSEKPAPAPDDAP